MMVFGAVQNYYGTKLAKEGPPTGHILMQKIKKGAVCFFSCLKFTQKGPNYTLASHTKIKAIHDRGVFVLLCIFAAAQDKRRQGFLSSSPTATIEFPQLYSGTGSVSVSTSYARECFFIRLGHCPPPKKERDFCLQKGTGRVRLSSPGWLALHASTDNGRSTRRLFLAPCGIITIITTAEVYLQMQLLSVQLLPKS
jgi:hypothetical protein